MAIFQLSRPQKPVKAPIKKPQDDSQLRGLASNVVAKSPLPAPTAPVTTAIESPSALSNLDTTTGRQAMEKSGDKGGKPGAPKSSQDRGFNSAIAAAAANKFAETERFRGLRPASDSNASKVPDDAAQHDADTSARDAWLAREEERNNRNKHTKPGTPDPTIWEKEDAGKIDIDNDGFIGNPKHNKRPGFDQQEKIAEENRYAAEAAMRRLMDFQAEDPAAKAAAKAEFEKKNAEDILAARSVAGKAGMGLSGAAQAMESDIRRKGARTEVAGMEEFDRARRQEEAQRLASAIGLTPELQRSEFEKRAFDKAMEMLNEENSTGAKIGEELGAALSGKSSPEGSIGAEAEKAKISGSRYEDHVKWALGSADGLPDNASYVGTDSSGALDLYVGPNGSDVYSVPASPSNPGK